MLFTDESNNTIYYLVFFFIANSSTQQKIKILQPFFHGLEIIQVAESNFAGLIVRKFSDGPLISFSCLDRK